MQKQESVTPTLLCIDGCGIWHPSRAGSAVYVSKLLQIPTIGVSKNYLEIDPCIDCGAFINVSQYKDLDLRTLMMSRENTDTVLQY